MTVASPGLGIIDIHGLLVRELRANEELDGFTSGRIFARKYPDRVGLPALRINYPNVAGLARPTLHWFSYDGQVDVHADSHIEASGIAAATQRALIALEQKEYPEGVLQAVEPFGVYSGFDTEWTPPKPRWIVSARIVARGP